MTIKIDNIHYDYNDKLCIVADVTLEDGSTITALEWIVDGRLDGADSHLFAVQTTNFCEDEIIDIIHAFRAFIAKNPTPDFSVSWFSYDNQGSIPDHNIYSADALESVFEGLKTDLLDECATDEEREDILIGSFVISHPVVADEVRPLR